MNEEINLWNFVTNLQQDLDSFRAWYLEEQAFNTQSYPLKMSEEAWREQFEVFLSIGFWRDDY